MKIKKIIIVFISSLLFILNGCIKDKNEVILRINFASEIDVNEIGTLIVTSTLENDVFFYESSDNNILTVSDEGMVKGLKEGYAKITVTSSSGKVIHHEIKVRPILYVNSIKFKLEEKTAYYAGVKYKYEVEYEPLNSINKNVRFSGLSLNVSLDEIEKTITFTRAGKATIFLYLEDDYQIQEKVELNILYDQNIKVYDLLFVGNSLTKYTYDIPNIIKQMMEEDGSVVYIDYSTSFQFLDQHKETVNKLLSKNKYTHVILQEKSDGLLTDFDRFESSVLEYDKQIKQNGAKTLLYQTWTYNYNDELLKQNMHQIVKEGYYKLALKTNSMISLVGEAFMEVMSKYPSIKLYDDLNHPSLEGAYLSALIHYKTITGNKAVSVNYLPQEISNETAKVLQKVVDYLVI